MFILNVLAKKKKMVNGGRLDLKSQFKDKWGGLNIQWVPWSQKAEKTCYLLDHVFVCGHERWASHSLKEATLFFVFVVVFLCFGGNSMSKALVKKLRGRKINFILRGILDKKFAPTTTGWELIPRVCNMHAIISILLKLDCMNCFLFDYNYILCKQLRKWACQVRHHIYL